MEQMHAWLLGVTACAVLVSLAEQLTDGAVRRCVSLIGGILLTLTLLSPVAALRAIELPAPRAEQREIEEQMNALYEDALGQGIAKQLDAYIEQRAAALGCPVEASTQLRITDGSAEIVCVTLRGTYSAALEAVLTDELGIAKENQIWMQKSS